MAGAPEERQINLMKESDDEPMTATNDLDGTDADTSGAQDSTRPRLVVADDDLGFRALLTELLQNSGYNVMPAGNGVETLAQCERHSPAAAVVDLVMPEKEGLETIFEIRRRFPGMRIIAISGGGRGPSDTYLAMARQLGANAALAKPFCAREILDTLKAVLAPPVAT